MVRITRIEPSGNSEGRRRKVAAYCRVSTDSDEQLESLDAQKEHYMQVISSHEDWEFSGLFYDEGISGTGVERRDGFRRMVEECRKGKIDMVLTKSISRFSRNTEDLLRTVRELSQINVAVFFERENINTLEMDGELMLSLLAGMAQDESASTSSNIRWTFQKKFRDGTFVVSTPPYGYRKEGRTMVPDPEAAMIVKEIFNLFLGGWGCDRIARALSRRGIKPPRGERWHPTTINGFLRNVTYTGDLVLQKTFSDDRFRMKVNRGEKPQYMVRDHHEAIISREDFEKVPEVMENNSRLRRVMAGSDKYQKRYPMTGKVFCSECGHVLKRKVIHSVLGDRVAWACSLHLKDAQACSLGYIQEASLCNAVMTMHNKLLFARRGVLGPVSAALQKDDEISAGLQAIGREMEENLRSRQRLRELLGKGFLEPAVFAQENCTLLERSRALTAKKDSLEEEAAERDGRVASLRELQRYLRTSDDKTEFDAVFFERHVERINVYSASSIGILLKCGVELKEVI